MADDATTPTTPTRVLVVDDEVALVTALRHTLAPHGYDTNGATTPSEALDILRRERFDVLLTDLQMPGMDGIAFMRSALELDPRMIAIIMTGHGSIDSAVSAMKAGALDYIQKPFKLSLVLAILGRAVAVRELRLQNEQLEQQLRRRAAELETANRDLQAFSHSVSHDLRGPLRAIEGLAAIVSEDLPTTATDETRHHLGRIVANVRRMNALVDDLLRLAQAAHMELRRETVDLGALSREIAQRLQAGEPDRHVQWAIEDDLHAKGDAALLRIALENLLSNAWKYVSRASAPRIEVGAQRTAGTAPVFFVRDNGVGFDAAAAERRLFAPFERFHPTSEFPGTGLGLTTVHRIIEKHRGWIRAESAPGQGATFLFSLPD